jgi:hypothetical protein
MEEGVAVTVMPVTVTGGAVVVTAMAAEPEMLVYPAWVDVAMHLAVPAPEGVKTPSCVMAPPVAVHVTAVL